MEISVRTSIADFIDIMDSIGFVTRKYNFYFSSTRIERAGRHHIIFSEVDGDVFCELHYDYHLHFLFLGVDYRKKPVHLFETELGILLIHNHIAYRTKDVDWFGRTNKALITGFRV